MAAARLFLLLVTAIAQQYAVTSPNARPPSEELRERRGAEHKMPLTIAIMKICIWSRTFLEGLVLFALSGHCPPTLAHSLLHFMLPTSLSSDPSATTLTTLTALTPTFLTGVLVSLAGSLLRGHCYHILGKRFTYELSIRPSHTLVTEGVYGVVRHPSYTAALMVAVGWLLCVSDRHGSVIAVCVGWLQAFGGNGSQSGYGDWDAMLTGVLACVWATVLCLLCLVAYKRITKEDSMLEKNFGEEWRAWATRVPYRMVPGVY
ncbi:hypothetical protein J3R82DRAFT_8916 [Butyriboletus roseoflavus]|nr:hypothetical protein J3R82DRAFT_8916 [Butyriboletus roseoflavus]